MKYISLLIITFLAFNSYATTIDLNIESSRIGVVDATHALLIPQQDITDSLSCANSNVIIWDKTTPHGEIMLSLALAGHISQKMMLVGIDNSTCINGRMLLQKIHVYE